MPDKIDIKYTELMYIIRKYQSKEMDKIPTIKALRVATATDPIGNPVIPLSLRDAVQIVEGDFKKFLHILNIINPVYVNASNVRDKLLDIRVHSESKFAQPDYKTMLLASTVCSTLFKDGSDEQMCDGVCTNCMTGEDGYLINDMESLSNKLRELNVVITKRG